MRRYENLRCEDRRCKDAQMSCGCEEIRCEDLRCEDPRHKMLQVQFFDTATVTRENKLTQKHKILASPHGTAGYPERNLHTATRQTRVPATQNFRSSYWRSYPKHNLHTAGRQTRMPGRHQRKIFPAPIGPATPNAIYTQHAAKPACQEHTNAKCSQLLSAQLPQTQFTHSAPPNPHARNTSAQNFRSSHWPSYPERNLHTTRRQTRMPGTHQRKIFAAPIGQATPNAIYTQHAAKPACQQDINTKFSQLRLGQLPRTQFTHSAPPNPHARNTSTQNFRSSIWHSYPKRNLHTARRQTRMPAEHQRKILATPIGAATPNKIYTQ